jgi:hypothetical protein
MSLSSLFNRGGKSTFNAPAVPQPTLHNVFRKTKQFCPLGYATGLAAKLNADVVSLVSALCFVVCPFAVTGFVVAVHIDPLNAESGLVSRPHIPPEVYEIPPSVTHLNTSSPVKAVVSCRGYIAAANHTHPYPVDPPFNTAPATGSSPMFGGRCTMLFVSPAPTRDSLSDPEMGTINRNRFPAIASAPPVVGSFPRVPCPYPFFGYTKNKQATKSLVSYVLEKVMSRRNNEFSLHASNGRVEVSACQQPNTVDGRDYFIPYYCTVNHA